MLMTNATDRALVRNAADPEQVKHARRKEKDQAGRFLDALRAVLATVEGRIVCHEWTARAGVYHSMGIRSGDELQYFVGQQDFGRRMIADCNAADDDLYELMEREHRAFLKRENAETDAVHTARAEQA